MSRGQSSSRGPARRVFPIARLAVLVGGFCGAIACSTTPEESSGLPARSQVAPAAEDAPAPPLLEAESEIARGELRRYPLELDPASTALEIVVEQLGVDVAVRLLDSGGKVLASADGPTGRQGVERIVVRAIAPAIYRIEIEAPGIGARGRYRLVARGLGGESPELLAGLEATRAAQLARSAEGRSAAIELYRSAIERLGDEAHAGERGRLHHALAVVLRREGEAQAAEAELAAAAGAWRTAGDRHGEARAHNELGLVAWGRGDGERALGAYEKALALRRELGDAFGEAQTINNIGLLHHSRGEPRAARERYRRALEIAARATAPRLEATLLNNLGGTAQDLGEPDAALDFFTRALALQRQIEDREGEARALVNIGATQRAIGAYERALESYAAALEIVRRGESAASEASLLNNVGVVYLALADGERATPYFERALEAFRRAGNRRGEAAALANLGDVRQRSGRQREALDHFLQALALRRELEDRRGEAIALDQAGTAHLALGELDAASEAFDGALALHRTLTDAVRTARVALHLAEVRLRQQRLAEAQRLLETALATQRRIVDRAGEAESLELLARLDRDAGRLEPARSRLEESLEIGDSRLARLAAPALRARLAASGRRAHEAYLDLLMRLDERQPGRGWGRRAFEASERGRARTLRAEIEAMSGSSSRPATELEAKRRRLAARLGAKAELRTRLLAREAAEQARTVEGELDEILTELDALDARLYRQAGNASLLAEPIRTREVQRLLAPDTVLLEYALGEERSFLWVVGADSFSAFVLPAAAEIAPPARRLHQLWSRLAPGESAEEQRLADRLARTLLAPAAEALAARRLVVVADGALHYLPFAALPDPLADAGHPLVAAHEVVSLPSVSVLAAQRRRDPEPRATGLELAILADPIFGPDDPRAAAAEGLSEPGTSGSDGELPRLAESAREARAIAALLPADRRRLALGAAASRSLLLEGELGPVRILHLATHGVLDDARPQLSGLMLSRLDAHGQRVEGFVTLADVYDLDLASELVVLSGCRTALGEEVGGEGLLGLTHAFFHAGAQRVLASLWRVQDRAAAELMTAFYRSLLVDGRPAAEALADAQRALLGDPRRRDPYHWAVFVLQGDWR